MNTKDEAFRQVCFHGLLGSLTLADDEMVFEDPEIGVQLRWALKSLAEETIRPSTNTINLGFDLGFSGLKERVSFRMANFTEIVRFRRCLAQRRGAKKCTVDLNKAPPMQPTPFDQSDLASGSVHSYLSFYSETEEEESMQSNIKEEEANGAATSTNTPNERKGSKGNVSKVTSKPGDVPLGALSAKKQACSQDLLPPDGQSPKMVTVTLPQPVQLAKTELDNASNPSSVVHGAASVEGPAFKQDQDKSFSASADLPYTAVSSISPSIPPIICSKPSSTAGSTAPQFDAVSHSSLTDLASHGSSVTTLLATNVTVPPLEIKRRDTPPKLPIPLATLPPDVESARHPRSRSSRSFCSVEEDYDIDELMALQRHASELNALTKRPSKNNKSLLDLEDSTVATASMVDCSLSMNNSFSSILIEEDGLSSREGGKSSMETFPVDLIRDHLRRRKRNLYCFLFCLLLLSLTISMLVAPMIFGGKDSSSKRPPKHEVASIPSEEGGYFQPQEEEMQPIVKPRPGKKFP